VPYIRDYFRRDPRSVDRLGIFLSLDRERLLLHASVVGVGHCGPNRLPQQGLPFVTFSAQLRWGLTLWTTKERNCALTSPRFFPKKVSSISKRTFGRPRYRKVILPMPNLEALHLVECAGGPRHSCCQTRMDRVRTQSFFPPYNDCTWKTVQAVFSEWWPLSQFATHQTSGNHPFSLILLGEYMHICPELAEEIGGLVEEFIYNRDARCPHRECDEELYEEEL
jgi:hypothetical protein